MADWETHRLGDVAQLKMGQSPPGSRVTDLDGGLPFLQGNAEFGSRCPTATLQCDEAARRSAPGDSLISVRAPVGAINRADRGYGIGRGLAAVTFDVIDPDFGHHALIKWSRDLQRVSQGTTFSAIGRMELAALQFPVPPLEEQRWIAEILDMIDETIQATERVIAKLRANTDGLIAGAAERALEAGRIRSLGEIADGSPGSLIQTGPFGSQLHASEYVSDGIPAFMPTDIKEGELDVGGAAKVSAKKADELGRHRLRVGDVLFARRGDLSRCALVAAEQSGGLCGTGCLLVRIPEEALSPDWLAAIYRHETVQRQVLGRAVGSTMLNLSASLIRSLLIPCPTQASRRLMAAAHASSARIEIERANLAKLVALRAGIAADLLSGRVRTATA